MSFPASYVAEIIGEKTRAKRRAKAREQSLNRPAEDFESMTGTKPSRATKRGRSLSGFVEQIFEAAGVHGKPQIITWRHYLGAN